MAIRPALRNTIVNGVPIYNGSRARPTAARANSEWDDHESMARTTAQYNNQNANQTPGQNNDPNCDTNGNHISQQNQYGQNPGSTGSTANNSQNGQPCDTARQQIAGRRGADVGWKSPPAALTVALPVPEIDWSYAVIERMNPQTLTTSLVPFNPGQLVLAHDAAQNLALEPGDVVTIFSQADIRVPQAQRTKFVRLEGEFKQAGIYSVLPGETLAPASGPCRRLYSRCLPVWIEFYPRVDPHPAAIAFE